MPKAAPPVHTAAPSKICRHPTRRRYSVREPRRHPSDEARRLNQKSNTDAVGAPTDDTADPRRLEVESAVIGHLFANIATPLITSTVIALFVLYVMWEVVAPAWLGAWFVAVVLMNGGRYLLLVQARRAPRAAS